MTILFSRRNLLYSGMIGLLSACSNHSSETKPTMTAVSKSVPSTMTPPSSTYISERNLQNTLRIFASSGFCEDPNRIQTGLERLSNAGFIISNQQAAYRRFYRFAGNDQERAADLQDVATGRVPTPKVLLGARGGYGAMRILPMVDWVNLGARMKEQQTLLFGFSDVTAIQLALLAHSQMPSFAGPMLYSEFAKPELSTYTMDSFIRTSTSSQLTVSIPIHQIQAVRSIDGICWGGNLSVLAALVGTPYMPKIQGGILFLEDVSEQPYRIERMLQTLYLSGILQQQQAIVLGDFRMDKIRDTYDSSYDLSTVVQTISRVAKIPVLTGFPFGHITNKNSFPLGAQASLRSDNMGGYQITFSQYPTLTATSLNLNSLLPLPMFNFNNNIYTEDISE